MPARAKKGERKRGRPALKPAQRKRSNITIRFRDETKTNLQRAASAAGRSLSEEIEARVEQWREYDHQFGGKELHSLFRMMGAAAQIIEERTGKSCTTDWETSLAVEAAWLQLMSSFSPRARRDSKYLESIGGPPLDFELPPPTLPEYPKAAMPSGGIGLLSKVLPSAEEIAAYEKQRAADEKAYTKWLKAVDEYRNKLEAARQHFEALKDLGKEVAVELFPPKTRG